ncbi:MAG: hypothetical protein HOW73_05010 [Polyangiaceae bacterium]|nr:hypothetical protein [Polyangiaceae bacterium]
MVFVEPRADVLEIEDDAVLLGGPGVLAGVGMSMPAISPIQLAGELVAGGTVYANEAESGNVRVALGGRLGLELWPADVPIEFVGRARFGYGALFYRGETYHSFVPETGVSIAWRIADVPEKGTTTLGINGSFQAFIGDKPAAGGVVGLEACFWFGEHDTVF